MDNVVSKSDGLAHVVEMHKLRFKYERVWQGGLVWVSHEQT